MALLVGIHEELNTSGVIICNHAGVVNSPKKQKMGSCLNTRDCLT